MYPSQLAANAQGGEKLVYQQMQKLPDDWVVFHDRWEHYKSEGRYVHYEADFIVLIPWKGLVVIEVKDWAYARIRGGVWESKGHSENDSWQSMGHKISPLSQADLAGRKLMQGLVGRRIISEKSQQRPEFRSMAILTNCVPDASDTPASRDTEISSRNNRSLESLYICGSDQLNDDLEERLLDLFIDTPKRGRHMCQTTVDLITEYLAPSIYFRLDLNNYMEMMNHESGHLSRMLPALYECTGGVHVKGFAGTGKTTVAHREAIRQAELLPENTEHKVLMLCYNNNLANHLRVHTPEDLLEQQLCVDTFHDYCIRNILQPAGRNDLISMNADVAYISHEDWQTILDDQLPIPQHHAIFVDEAQDFRAEWWEIIKRSLLPGGKLYIFSDPHQTLYANSNVIPPVPTQVSLVRNMRNAREIAMFSAALLPEDTQMLPLELSGPQIDIAPGSDDPELRAAYVEGTIEKILRENAYSSTKRDIVVLSPWRASNPNCSFPYAEGLVYAEELENARQTAERHHLCTQKGCELVLADTIKAFKGLETPFLILTDIPAPEEAQWFSINEFYVACSRARFSLHIIPTVKGEQFARQFLEKIQQVNPPHPGEW